MVAGQSTNRPDCIERRQLISLMDKTTLKQRIKLKLKKAVDIAWKAKQAKEKQAKRSRKENEVVKKKSHSKALKPKRQGDAKQKNRPRPVRHADFVLRAHLKNVSEAQLLKAEEEGNDKGVQGNPHCKRLCTWDCDGFRCFRRCVCNRTK